MSAAGALELDRMLRTRLLTFVPADGSATLTVQLPGGLWIDEAPDDVTAPYGVVRVADAPTSGDAHLRKQALVECLFYGRNSADRPTLKRAADVAEQALLNFVDASTGVAVLTQTRVQWLPPFAAPADRELIAVRIAATLYWYPDMLTQYAVAGAGDAV